MTSDGSITSVTEFLLQNSRVVTIVETYLYCSTNELQTEGGRATTKKNKLATCPCPLSF